MGAMFMMLIGPPGCGKTSVANRVADDYGYSVVSSDKVREELYGDEEIQGDSEEVFARVHSDILNLLSEGKDVVMDATNCAYKYRAEILRPVRYLDGVNVIGVVFDGDLDECLVNNRKRKRYVPHRIVKKMWNSLRLNPPQFEEGFDFIVNMSVFEELLKLLDGASIKEALDGAVLGMSSSKDD